MEEKNVFEILNAVDVNGKSESKNGLTYLSWAWAWGEVKKRYPDANYKIYENADGWNYFTDGRTGWVKTSVTINGLEHIDYLPIMDNYNKSIPLDKITSFVVNKTIQRSITKACARHGLGLYIYAGEDLPENAENTTEPSNGTPKAKTPEKQAKEPSQDDLPFPVDDCDIDEAIQREIELKNILLNEEWYDGLMRYCENTFGTNNLAKINLVQYKQLKWLAEKKVKQMRG